MGTVIGEPGGVGGSECSVRVYGACEVYFKEIVCWVLFFSKFLDCGEGYEVLQVEDIGK